MRLQQLVKVKATGQTVRICGFADPSKLPKRGDEFFDAVCRDFDRDSGIPHVFDAEWKDKSPSGDALFCLWHEDDPNHPLRRSQTSRECNADGYVHGWFKAEEVTEV